SGEDVGARGIEELIAVVMVDVLVGGRVGVGSEAEVATDDDPRLFGAACVLPGRPGRGDTAEQGIEAEQRSNPAAAAPGHPLTRTRGEPAEQETRTIGRQGGERPAGAGHLTLPGAEHDLEHVVEDGAPAGEIDAALPV